MSQSQNRSTTTIEVGGTGPREFGLGPLELVVLGKGEASYYPLPTNGAASIGRSADNLITIDDPSVSREHAVLEIGGTVRLRDLRSRNGTRLGGRTLEEGDSANVPVGAAIQFGSVSAVLQNRAPVGVTREVRRKIVAPALTGGPVFSSPAMKDVYQMAELVAPDTISVLLLGETGVGKEIVAETIHRLSPRANMPFLRMHCAAIPENLFESELFGYEKGAFTGAMQAKAGLLEAAEGGTVLIDEAGELPSFAQVKLLRVLEERRVTRLGSTQSRPINVRVISATHRDLVERIRGGEFREDLYFRLAGFTIVIPSLRERLDELPDLSAHILALACAERNIPVPGITPGALRALALHPWNGNVRELRNVLTRALVLSRGKEIEEVHLRFDPSTTEARPRSEERPIAEDSSLVEITDERARIEEALRRTGGNQTEAARLLGIGRRTLIERLDKYGVVRPRKPV